VELRDPLLFDLRYCRAAVGAVSGDACLCDRAAADGLPDVVMRHMVSRGDSSSTHYSRVLTEHALACGEFLVEAGMRLLDVPEHALRCAWLHV
jgi:hypothetical protein